MTTHSYDFVRAFNKKSGARGKGGGCKTSFTVPNYNIFLSRVCVSVSYLQPIYTHYIHSVVVQDFVSGRACCVNKHHYESR